MKDRIIRTKQFVVKHSHELSAAAGVAVGVAVTYKFTKSPPLPNLLLHVTTEDLHNLLEKPGYVSFDVPEMPELVIDLIVDRTE
jgi:hypothetical protein